MTVLQEIYGYAFPAILASGPVLQEIGKTDFPAIIAFVTTLQETDEVLFLQPMPLVQFCRKHKLRIIRQK